MGISSWAYDKNQYWLMDIIDTLNRTGYSQDRWEEEHDDKLKKRLPDEMARKRAIKSEARLKNLNRG